MKAPSWPGRHEKGIALVSVLWVVLLLSIVAGSMIASSRANRVLSGATYDQARGEAIAEAGIVRALLALLDGRVEKRWKTDGTPYDFSFADTVVVVSIEDETGKIDLNTGSDELLRNLFKSVGLSDDAADGLVDKIGDWRDEDDLRRLHGAESDEYRERNFPYGPKNGPFDTVDELQQVMDVTSDLFKRLKPAVTVYSSRQSIDPAVAPAEALAALPQMDAAQVDAILSSRQPTNSSSDAAPASSQMSRDAITGKAFTIRAEVHVKADAAFTLEKVVRFTGTPNQPFWVLRSTEASGR